MTREEAIKYIRNVLKGREDKRGKTEIDIALEMAIEALEQEPCEDSIVEWKKDFKGYVNSLSMPRDDYKGIMEYIDELPVKPQPKMGHWEYNPLDICFQCSQCKCCCEDDYKQPPKYKYCPQCGAKMQEVEENGIN